MNIILQHWNGPLPEWARVAKTTMERYANWNGCDYQLVTGHPLGEKLGPNPQKLVYVQEEYDRYDKVLMLDMDMIATSSYVDVFKRPEIGVLHSRAMNGTSRTPGSAPELFTLGMPIFFGNYIMTTREQRIAMREHADWDWLATKVVDTYAGDEMVLAWLLQQAGLLDNMSIEEMCMRRSGTSYKDIHVREHNRWDKKFTNLAFGADGPDDPSGSDPDATFLHFGQHRKNSIPTYVRKIHGLSIL